MPFAAETPRPATQVAPRTPPAGEATEAASPCADVVLAIEALTKRYGSLVAVDGISFEVRRGETFGILGPNGAGKTTTLEMIEGLRKPDAGRITLLGLDAVRPASRAAASLRRTAWSISGALRGPRRRALARGGAR